MPSRIGLALNSTRLRARQGLTKAELQAMTNAELMCRYIVLQIVCRDKNEDMEEDGVQTMSRAPLASLRYQRTLN